jgi:hypothetical protein
MWTDGSLKRSSFHISVPVRAYLLDDTMQNKREEQITPYGVTTNEVSGIDEET